MRLFLAVNLAPEIHQYINQIKEQVAESGRDFSFVAEGNHHITLFFLGQVKETSLFDIKNALTRVCEAQFSFAVETGRLILFPGIAKARMIWLEVVDQQANLTRLHSGLSEALSALGFESEDRQFHPHITIARRKKPLVARTSHLEEAISSVEVARRTITVQSIDIMSSVQKGTGPVYELVDQVNF